MRRRDVPRGWHIRTISEVVESSRPVTYGVVQPGPRHEHGVPIIRGQDYSSGEVATEGLYRVHPSIAAAYRRSTVQGGDLLLSIVGYVGQVAEVPDELAGANLTQTTARIAVRSGLVPRYFLHYFRSVGFQEAVRRFTKGSAQPGLNLRDVEKLELLVPPLMEQHQIAEVLDTVDEAIRRTEQLIAKLERMKQGLLHDLLTRGIDQNGDLRDPERHPEQFNDGPLGALPATWRVTTLGDVVRECGGFIQTGPFGSQLHAHEYVTDGVPVVMPQDIDGDQFNEARISRITERRATDLGRHRLRRNDTVFARRGDLSRCAPVSASEEGWLCGTGCLLARIPQGALIGEWLAAVYRHDIGQRQVAARAVGSTMVNLNTTILSRLTIPIPLAQEQRDVIARVNELKNRTHSEEEVLRKLHALNSGLMDDLLTGRVRVTEHIEGNVT